jgi:UDP-N-acetylglucosamine diphosphorylase/glucosamine-1-phosphate N-acetyltransferase
MSFILFDTPDHVLDLRPFTFTRPISHFRVGILTIKEKWEKHSGLEFQVSTCDLLTGQYPVSLTDDNLLIYAGLLPDPTTTRRIFALGMREALVNNAEVLAVRLGKSDAEQFLSSFQTTSFNEIHFDHHIRSITRLWHIFKHNGAEIREDFSLLTHGRTSQPIHDPYIMIYGKENVFVEEGAKLRACIINAEDGPVYIGKNANIQEGAIIHGPLGICEGAHINMGAKMRGDNTVGPYCKVGGEVSNTVFFGYSNKGHDGFIGNSVVGEWCNIGADTNTSNLKNTYAEVKLWNYRIKRFEATGEQFCGLMMGDHSKCGINTMFNTGTVVGVGANIFGDGFPRNFIPSFSWGGAAGLTTYKPDKFFESAEAMMARRNKKMSEQEKSMYIEIYALTETNRA